MNNGLYKKTFDLFVLQLRRQLFAVREDFVRMI